MAASGGGSADDAVYIDYPQTYYEAISLRIFPELRGTTQSMPLKPDEIYETALYRFSNVPSVLWFDPTPARGFAYEMTDGDVLFNRILDFPTDLNGPVTVSVDGQDLGQFGPGDSVDFVTLLGEGVRRFDVIGDWSPRSGITQTDASHPADPGSRGKSSSWCCVLHGRIRRGATIVFRER